MADLGKMRYFLGVEMRQTEQGICKGDFGEIWYAGLQSCQKNPCVPGTLLSKEGVNEVDGTVYKQLVGCLMYLTVTLPDLMYTVCLILRYMSNPKEEHMLIAKRALSYLKGTLDFGLMYQREAKMNVVAYTDSDYARDMDDRKSISGYVFLFNGSAVCWSSHKQAIVTSSSTKAEYVAATSCACHCVWVKGILGQMNCICCRCITILCDNSSAIKLSKNPVMHRRTKHIDVRFHYLRDLVNDGVVELSFCASEEQVADIMTKPLSLDQFVKLRRSLGV
ncbi:unnamed protein product [Rhodiola kirilowii]